MIPLDVRRISFFVAMGCTATALVVTACVGDDPGASSGALPDSGGDSTETDASNPDTSKPDTGPAADAGADTSVFCMPAQPQLFPSIPNTGPFCQGAPGNHCAMGEHCCRDLAANTQACAASCPASVVDIACFNAAECGDGGVSNLKCCASGTPKKNVCTYTVLDDWTKSRCAAACTASEFQQCEGNAECNGTTCTPMRALTPDNKSTTNAMAGACL